MWIEDLRYAVRSFRNRPGFVILTVLTLAIGIGASAVIFSLVDHVILKPLPFPEPERLVSFFSYYSNQAMRGAFSPPTYVDYRNALQSFRSISATAPWNANLTGKEEPERIKAQQVSANFFETLGAVPALGRTFLPNEEQPGNEHVVVLSDRLWKQKFAGDPGIVGKPVLLNDLAFTVIGVMPPGFHWGMNYGKDADASLWVPLALTPERIAEEMRGNEYIDLIGRIREGTSRQQAEAELLALNRQLHTLHPNHYQFDHAWILQLRPLKDDVVADIRPFLMILLLSVALMLFIACNNIAGLLLLRGAERRREIAIRSALGAHRLRLVRQILLECLLLALAGGALGFIFASWSLHAVKAVAGAALPRAAEIGLDFRFLAAAATLTLLAGIFFGILPALRLTQSSYESLKEGGRSATMGPRRHRTIQAIVVSQIALSLVLMVGAGLLLQSFRRILAVHPGFSAGNVLTMSIAMSPARYPIDRREAFLRQVLERIRAVPGVQYAGATSNLPMGGEQSSSSFYVEGRPQRPGEQLPQAENWVVTPGYFQAMSIPVFQGRDFSMHDSAGSLPVVIIDEVLAQRYWPGQNPVGKRMDYEGTDEKHEWMEVVGVVGQVRQRGLEDMPRPEFYVPYGQNPSRNMSFVIRTSFDPSAAAAIRAVHEVDPNQPVYRVASMGGIIATSLTQRRLVALLMGGFAVFALFLTALGLFGVLASSVADRTHEFGIRMILGAAPRDVLKMVLNHMLRLTAAGIVLGAAGAVGATRFLTTLLFEVKALDPWTFVAVAAILVLVALAACSVPLRRATRVEPAAALRHE